MMGRQAAQHNAVENEPAPRLVVAGGLTVGVMLGFSGNFVPPGDVQNLMYAVSAAGLILGAVVLAMHLVASSQPLAAAAFALIAVGESRLLTPTGEPGAQSSFAGGVLLYVPALVLLAWVGWAPVWVRIAGVASATFFAAHSLIFFGGGPVDPAGPLPAIGYTLFTVTTAGWILRVLRPAEPTSSEVDAVRRPPGDAVSRG